MFSHEAEILRKLRLIEHLKADLVSNVGELLRAVAENAESAIAESLASVVICCYVLGRRLGVDFKALDDAVLARVALNIKKDHEVEKWFGDLSEYQHYLRQKR
ncbi:Hypothetical protein LUCI_2774 [Lucifera butyrica]|uniref:MazG-like family protein n=1 Tax=Lucifera butyrica TaxID=1351585 RepID=A0A498R952_9FIRM|nr:MazG-like family protein [Lucifera butyrica]VBB07525.1 Hypothetical protein LUCI_2774 [Lucifera butyrica]